MNPHAKGCLRLFQVRGITVFVHWSWFLVAVFEISSAEQRYPSIAWNVVEYLALFGIVSPKFLWKNIRYAILAVFIVAACICPSPDPWTMCIYAIPLLTLYLIGIGVAWWVHPTRRKAKQARESAP